jgi:hypothetical protein
MADMGEPSDFPRDAGAEQKVFYPREDGHGHDW